MTFGENKTNRYIGYLPDVPEFYGFMTPAEYLAMCGSIAGLEKGEIRRRSEELLDLVGLLHEKKRIHGFSRGMKQRLGIAQALLGNPRLLICDEPTSALDPVGRREILNILTSVREHTTVVFSTHILSDVERICDCAAFLHGGRIALEGSIEDMKRARGGSGLEIEFVKAEDKAGFENAFPGGIQEGELRLRYEKKTEPESIRMLAHIAGQGIAVRRYEMLERRLRICLWRCLENETAVCLLGKKEWMELVRSGKFLVLLILFLSVRHYESGGCKAYALMMQAMSESLARGGISGRPRNGGRDDLLGTAKFFIRICPYC